MFKSFSDLQDVVSVLVFCDDDKSYMLTLENSNELWIPSVPVNADWRATARRMLTEFYSIDPVSQEIAKLYKIYQGEENRCLYHVIFTVAVTSEAKRKSRVANCIKSRVKVRWVSDQELDRMSSYEFLRSPEILTVIARIKGKVPEFLEPKGYRRPSLDTLSWSEVLGSESLDLLVEVLDQHICLPPSKLPTGNRPMYEELVESAGFGQNEQKWLYSEFLYRSFPCLYMGKEQFTDLLSKLNWPKDEMANAFRSADLFCRRALSFRDVLFFLAAIEPSTTHSGFPAELRCRYIFRYFDKNADNSLEYGEFKNMVAALKKTKNERVDPSSVAKDADLQATNMGLKLNSPCTLKEFLYAVSDMKFRGTSSMLRCSVSVKDFLRESREAGGKGDTSKAQSGTPKQVGSAAARDHRVSVHGSSSEYDVAVHCVRLRKSGTNVNVDTMYEIEAAMSRSTDDDEKMKAMRALSDSSFDTRAVSNELLTGLKYFSTPVLPGAATGKRPKEAYSWGLVDKSGFGQCFIKVCDIAKGICKAESRLLELTSPVYVLGDFHGNYPDLMYFEKVLWNLGPGLTPGKLLFLGDYVDRGPHGVEVIGYLLSHKVQFPNKVRLLRGNHEVRDVQKVFTFHRECIQKFGQTLGTQVWEAANDVFDVMPIAAVIDSKVFCCHGGIPPPWLCPNISAINSIPSPLRQPDEQSALAWDLMWNDPVKAQKITDSLALELMNNEGFAVNKRRGTAHVFSSEALEKFLRGNGLSQVIRAHEVAQVGFQLQHRGRLMTVFSSSRYCGGSNEAACILAEHNKLRVFRLEHC